MLSELIERAEGEEAVQLNTMFALHRVAPGDMTGRLITLAVTDARARAEAAVSGAGRSIDRVLRIEDSRDSGGGPRPMMNYAAAERAAATPTPIEPGFIEIHARVTLTASMK